MFQDEINLTRNFRQAEVQDFKVGIVQALFNRHITDKIVADCQNELLQQGLSSNNIYCCSVPGALEIGLALQLLLTSQRYDVLIAVGCVIRGATYHFELVANKSADAVNQLVLQHQVPIINSILTTEDEQQASQRAAVKGIVNAHDALTMALLSKQLKSA